MMFWRLFWTILNIVWTLSLSLIKIQCLIAVLYRLSLLDGKSNSGLSWNGFKEYYEQNIIKIAVLHLVLFLIHIIKGVNDTFTSNQTKEFTYLFAFGVSYYFLTMYYIKNFDIAYIDILLIFIKSILAVRLLNFMMKRFVFKQFPKIKSTIQTNSDNLVVKLYNYICNIDLGHLYVYFLYCFCLATILPI